MLQVKFDREQALARIPRRQPDGSIDGVLFFQQKPNPNGPGVTWWVGNYTGPCQVTTNDGEIDKILTDAEDVVTALVVMRHAVLRALEAQGIDDFTVGWRFDMVDGSPMLKWDNSDVDATLTEQTAVLALYSKPFPIIIWDAQAFMRANQKEQKR